jgi:hypothetical protein
MMTLEISQQDPKLDDGYPLQIDISNAEPVINASDTITDHNNNANNQTQLPPTQRPFTFPTILKMITNAIMNPFDSDEEDETTTAEADKPNNTPPVPTMIDFLEKTKRKHGIELDENQLIAYQMICTSFMINLHIPATQQRT